MKKLIGIFLIVAGLFFVPEAIDAVAYDCKVADSGRYYCKYHYQVNDGNFRFAISKVKTNSTKTKLYLYGWGFLDSANSYNDFNNAYEMQLFYYDSANEKYVQINDSSIISTSRVANGKVDFTCTFYHKDGVYFKDNDTCYEKVKAGSKTIKKHILSNNKKTSSEKNNILRNVGFTTTIDLTKLTSFLQSKIPVTCPKPGSDWCKKKCPANKISTCTYSKDFI